METDLSSFNIHDQHFSQPEETLSHLSSQFKDKREQIKQKNRKDKETEILSTLLATSGGKVADFGAAQNAIQQWDNWFLLRVVFVLTLSGFISGYDLGAVSLISLLLVNNQITYFNSDQVGIGTFVAIGSFGAAIGSLLAGPSVDRFGRKQIVFVSGFLFIFGGLLMALVQSMLGLVIGRLMAGTATGIASMNVPLYISEICPIQMRGRVIAIYTFLVTFGQFIVLVFGFLLLDDQTIQWRWVLVIGVLCALVQMMGMFLLPDSPRWLANKNRKEEAQACLRLVYKPAFVQVYINSLEKENKFGRNQTLLRWFPKVKELFRNYKKCLGMGCGLMVCQQLSGITIVNSYGPALVSNARFNQHGSCYNDLTQSSIRYALLWSLPLGFVRVLGTIIAIMVVDRRGRRRVLLRTIPIIIVCVVGLTTAFWLFILEIGCDVAKFVGLICTVMFLVTYSAGLDTIPWLVNSEIYPPALIGTASSLAAFTNWFINYILLQTFYRDSPDLYFLSLSVANVLSYMFVWYACTETNGNTNIKNMSLILGKSVREVTQMMKGLGAQQTQLNMDPQQIGDWSSDDASIKK